MVEGGDAAEGRDFRHGGIAVNAQVSAFATAIIEPLKC